MAFNRDPPFGMDKIDVDVVEMPKGRDKVLVRPVPPVDLRPRAVRAQVRVAHDTEGDVRRPGRSPSLRRGEDPPHAKGRQSCGGGHTFEKLSSCSFHFLAILTVNIVSAYFMATPSL